MGVKQGNVQWFWTQYCDKMLRLWCVVLGSLNWFNSASKKILNKPFIPLHCLYCFCFTQRHFFSHFLVPFVDELLTSLFTKLLERSCVGREDHEAPSLLLVANRLPQSFNQSRDVGEMQVVPSRNLSASNRLPPTLSESQLLRIVVLALQGWRDPLMLQAAAASQDTLHYRTIERSYDLQETGEGATVTSVSHIEGSRTESSNTFFDSNINVNPSRFFQLK